MPSTGPGHSVSSARPQNSARTSHWPQSSRTRVALGHGHPCCSDRSWSFTIIRSNPYAPKPSVTSTLPEVYPLADSTVSSTWPTTGHCEIRGYPAVDVHDLDVDYPHAGERSRLRAALACGVACPPQWLPVLLTVALPSQPLLPPSPPPSSPPPLMPPDTDTKTDTFLDS